MGHISSTKEGLKFTISKLYFVIYDSFAVHLLQSYNDIDIFPHSIAIDVPMKLFGLDLIVHGNTCKLKDCFRGSA